MVMGDGWRRGGVGVCAPDAYSAGLRRELQREIETRLGATYCDSGLFVGRFNVVLLHYYVTGVSFPDGDGVTKSPVRPRSAAPQFKEINTFEGCSKTVAAVQFSPDGSMLAAACADKTVRIFNGETGEHVETLLGHTLGVSDV